MTAREAVEAASGHIAEFDSKAEPMLLSTSDIDESGRSPTWECNFDSRTRLARLWIEFGPEATVFRGVPLISHRPESFMPELWRRLDRAGRDVYHKEWFKTKKLSGFIDSDVAVRSLQESHDDIDLVSGSTNVSLATDRETEEWVLSIGRRSWRTPLHSKD